MSPGVGQFTYPCLHKRTNIQLSYKIIHLGLKVTTERNRDDDLANRYWILISRQVLFSIWGALHFSGAHDVIVNTSPQTNDLCTEELRGRAQQWTRSVCHLEKLVYFSLGERGLWS